MFWTFYLYSIALELIMFGLLIYKTYKRALVDPDLRDYLDNASSPSFGPNDGLIICCMILPFANLFICFLLGVLLFNNEAFDYIIDRFIHM